MFLAGADVAVVRLFLSVLFGSIVGMERELTHKSAGLRTHILVCLGSTAFTLVSIYPLFPGVHSDPGRIAAQIVSGIGFIGGGSVLRMRGSVKGLTTAASLWVIAAIGMLTGAGHLRLAAVCTLLAFLVLFSIGNLEKTFLRRPRQAAYQLDLHLTCGTAQRDSLKQWLQNTLPGHHWKESWQKDHWQLTTQASLFIEPSLPTLQAQLVELPGVTIEQMTLTHQPVMTAAERLAEENNSD
jgi:uncharacterized membrane protein YhiD involved in acid resistance